MNDPTRPSEPTAFEKQAGSDYTSLRFGSANPTANCDCSTCDRDELLKKLNDQQDELQITKDRLELAEGRARRFEESAQGWEHLADLRGQSIRGLIDGSEIATEGLKVAGEEIDRLRSEIAALTAQDSSGVSGSVSARQAAGSENPEQA